MKDYLGNNLQKGEMVVLVAPRYRHLTTGIIIAFTPQKVRVQYNNTWNFSGRIEEVLQTPDQLVRINT